MTATVLFVVLVVLVAGVQIAVLMWATKKTLKRPSVYRRVVNETDQTVTLECGHAFTVIRHKRESFPCPECALTLRNDKAGL
jgi:uncharacterized paraquat-inducible protein A